MDGAIRLGMNEGAGGMQLDLSAAQRTIATLVEMLPAGQERLAGIPEMRIKRYESLDIAEAGMDCPACDAYARAEVSEYLLESLSGVSLLNYHARLRQTLLEHLEQQGCVHAGFRRPAPFVGQEFDSVLNSGACATSAPEDLSEYRYRSRFASSPPSFLGCRVEMVSQPLSPPYFTRPEAVVIAAMGIRMMDRMMEATVPDFVYRALVNWYDIPEIPWTAVFCDCGQTYKVPMFTGRVPTDVFCPCGRTWNVMEIEWERFGEQEGEHV
jgi:hypothetical protein